MKLRGFKRTYIGRVRLIQQHGEFAEHRPRLRHLGDLDAFPNDFDRALLNLSPFLSPLTGPASPCSPQARRPAGCRSLSFLWKTAISGIRGVGMFGPPSPLRAAHAPPSPVCVVASPGPPSPALAGRAFMRSAPCLVCAWG